MFHTKYIFDASIVLPSTRSSIGIYRTTKTVYKTTKIYIFSLVWHALVWLAAPNTWRHTSSQHQKHFQILKCMRLVFLMWTGSVVSFRFNNITWAVWTWAWARVRMDIPMFHSFSRSSIQLLLTATALLLGMGMSIALSLSFGSINYSWKLSCPHTHTHSICTSIRSHATWCERCITDRFAIHLLDDRRQQRRWIELLLLLHQMPSM